MTKYEKEQALLTVTYKNHHKTVLLKDKKYKCMSICIHFCLHIGMHTHNYM